jgi:maltose alpha-D-glucosyltransferase/alpha-amylase
MGRPDLRDPLAPALDEWLKEATQFFLKGYRRAAVESNCVPADDPAFAKLIALFQIDCALRELRRELEHRPAWIEVPIHALLILVGQASA